MRTLAYSCYLSLLRYIALRRLPDATDTLHVHH